MLRDLESDMIGVNYLQAAEKYGEFLKHNIYLKGRFKAS